ncbi:MAG: tRNA pseudouridine(55) synthase TruB [Lachnospiraceae bacterium]|nr:tRNA pseudouridine(55) synthase TruB [Lachnospiraceae bacterium]
MNGIINVYKEKGFTSHDVVAKLRGILRQRKIGHTGTLDPDAVGVLPVCLGKATKLCDFFVDKEKEYRAVLLLGVETDTQDASGRILKECKAKLNEEEVRKAVLSFIGEYDQIPPMYSALKVDGKKLYELAREGKTVDRQARRITIYDIVIEDMSLPRVTFTVRCSKGTYIRTLCNDIGEKLGCGGCMESLVRTQSGIFKLEDSLTLSEIEKLRDNGTLEEHIYPIDRAFASYPKAYAKKDAGKMLYNGNPMYENQLASECGSSALKGSDICIYDSEGVFIGVYRYSEKIKQFKPVKVFLGGE